MVRPVMEKIRESWSQTMSESDLAVRSFCVSVTRTCFLPHPDCVSTVPARWRFSCLLGATNANNASSI